MKLHLPLAWKMIIGFSFITLCIGLTGLVGVESMDSVTTKLSNARIEASYHSRAIYRYLLVRSEDRDSVRQTLFHRQNTVNEQIALYRSTSLSD